MIAQVNIARPLHPMESAEMADFMDALDPINALADAAPGFVWRLQDDDGNATSFRVFEDESLLINMSVWESVEALHDFVYSGEHLAIMRRRREWFEWLGQQYLVLWPTDEIPPVEEAKRRLEMLEENGPSPQAFTFKDYRSFLAP